MITITNKNIQPPTAIHLILGKSDSNSSNLDKQTNKVTSELMHKHNHTFSFLPIQSTPTEFINNNNLSCGSVVSNDTKPTSLTAETGDNNSTMADDNFHRQLQKGGEGLDTCRDFCFEPIEIIPMDNYQKSQQHMRNHNFHSSNHLSLHHSRSSIDTSSTNLASAATPLSKGSINNRSKSMTALHMQGTDPRDQDVLLGRGKSHQRHPGVVLFNDLVNMNRIQYFDVTTHQEKKTITELIVNKILGTGGRFLKMEKSIQNWVEISREAARVKVAQALQYRQRRNISEGEEVNQNHSSSFISMSSNVRKQHCKNSTSSMIQSVDASIRNVDKPSVAAAAMMMRDHQRQSINIKNGLHRVPLQSKSAGHTGDSNDGASAFELDPFQWSENGGSSTGNFPLSQLTHFPSKDACVTGIYPMPLTRKIMGGAGSSLLSRNQVVDAGYGCKSKTASSFQYKGNLGKQKFNLMQNTLPLGQSQHGDHQVLGQRTTSTPFTSNNMMTMHTTPVRTSQLQSEDQLRSFSHATPQKSTVMMKQIAPSNALALGGMEETGNFDFNIESGPLFSSDNRGHQEGNSNTATYAFQSTSSRTNTLQSDSLQHAWELSAENDDQAVAANFQW